jgi:dyslexia susceptibility 1 candidate gene 1 protein
MVSDSVQQDVISTGNKSVISKKNTSTNEPKSTEEPDEDIKPVPLPRNCSTIKVCFTARPFPTPQRESQAPEEEEVLRLYECSE